MFPRDVLVRALFAGLTAALKVIEEHLTHTVTVPSAPEPRDEGDRPANQEQV